MKYKVEFVTGTHMVFETKNENIPVSASGYEYVFGNSRIPMDNVLWVEPVYEDDETSEANPVKPILQSVDISSENPGYPIDEEKLDKPLNPVENWMQEQDFEFEQIYLKRLSALQNELNRRMETIFHEMFPFVEDKPPSFNLVQIDAEVRGLI